VPGGVQGWDRYAYLNNNPVRFADPTGHREACGAYTQDCGDDQAPPRPDDDEGAVDREGNGGGDSGPDLPSDWWIPTEFGWRDQLEGCVKVPIPVGACGTLGLNIVYNRSSGEIIGYVDWSYPVGVGAGGGGSLTTGPLLGCFASDTDNIISSPSYNLGGTLANEAAASISVTSPLVADKTYGAVPLLFYGGGGGGGFYGGGGVGQSGTLVAASVSVNDLFTP